MEIAIHHFDLWRFLVGSEVEEVFCMNRSGTWDDEAATVTARTTNGVLVATVLLERTGQTNEVEIHGRAGCLSFSLHRFDSLEFRPTASYSRDTQVRLRPVAHTLNELPRGLAMLRRRRRSQFYAFRAEWQHLLNSIREDTPLECTLEDGQRALEIAMAAAESASHGRPVRVTEPPRKITPVRHGQEIDV